MKDLRPGSKNQETVKVVINADQWQDMPREKQEIFLQILTDRKGVKNIPPLYGKGISDIQEIICKNILSLDRQNLSVSEIESLSGLDWVILVQKAWDLVVT